MTRREINPIPIQSWFARRGNIVLLIAALFLLISAFTYFLCSRHYQQVKEHTLQDDRNIASLCAMLVEVHLHDIISSMESYANRPLLIRAVADKNTDKAREHLLNLIRINPAIDSVIITGPDGTAWISQPHRPELMGKNFAYRDWYRGVSRRWTPYVSQAEKRLAGEKDTAIYIAVPVLDDKGRPIGILVNTERTVEIGNIFKQVPLERDASLSIIDRNGMLIYSSRKAYDKALIRCSFFEAFKSSMAGGAKVQTFLATDPREAGAIRHISFVELRNTGWHVLVGHDKDTIIANAAVYITQIIAIALLLFLSIILALLYIRKRVILQTLRDHLRAEKDLLASETRFRELFDHMSNGVAIYEAVNNGEDFIFSDMNMAGRRITGVSEGYVGKSVREVFPGVEKFGLFQIFQQVWRTGIAQFHPTSMYTDQHLAFWAENHVYKLPSGQIVAVFDDVTESKRAEDALKESEKKLREAQEMAHLGFWNWDIKTGNVEWSNEVFRIFGLNPKEFKPRIDSILAMSPWPGDHERDQELIRQAIENHSPGFYEQKFLRPDQSVGYYNSTFRGNYDEHGELVSIVGTVLDITERKEAEERIKKLNEELEEKVAQRTAELIAQNAELERLNHVFVDREIKMRELKARIAELEKK